MSKEERTAKILELISDCQDKVKADPLAIHDRDIFNLSNEFYMRDWDVDNQGHNVEGLAFQRGIVIGMQLYRQIANPK